MYYNEIEIKHILNDSYMDTYEVYEKMSKNQRDILYHSLFDDMSRRKIDDNEGYMFASLPIKPQDCVHEINLIFERHQTIKIYFLSLVDLRENVDLIINDNNFKRLVLLMFYIKDYIKPIECNL